MKHERIYKRDDGSRVKISVYLRIVHSIDDGAPEYSVTVERCEPRKQKFIDVVDTNSYDYRKQDFPKGRDKWAAAKQLEYVTPDEIHRAKLDLWEKLKPQP